MSGNISIELTILVSVVSLCCTIIATSRNWKKDTKEERSTSTTVLVKLENIQTSINEIKLDVKNVRDEIKDLERRVTLNERSLKSIWKQLDKVDIRNES